MPYRDFGFLENLPHYSRLQEGLHWRLLKFLGRLASFYHLQALFQLHRSDIFTDSIFQFVVGKELVTIHPTSIPSFSTLLLNRSCAALRAHLILAFLFLAASWRPPPTLTRSPLSFITPHCSPAPAYSWRHACCGGENWASVQRRKMLFSRANKGKSH